MGTRSPAGAAAPPPPPDELTGGAPGCTIFGRAAALAMVAADNVAQGLSAPFVTEAARSSPGSCVPPWLTPVKLELMGTFPSPSAACATWIEPVCVLISRAETCTFALADFPPNVVLVPGRRIAEP